MARKPEVAVLAIAPALPAASVDFNAFESAIAAGSTAEEAVAAGIGEPAPVPAPDEPTEPAIPDAPAENSDAD